MEIFNIDKCLWQNIFYYLDSPSKCSMSLVNHEFYNKTDNNEEILLECCKLGYLDILIWIGIGPCKEMLFTAAQNGLQWNYDKTAKIHKDFVIYAARGDHIKVYNWATKRHREDQLYCSVKNAVKYGQLDFLKSLPKLEQVDWDIPCLAAKYGRVDVLKWFLESGFRYQGVSPHFRSNHIEILDLLESKGYPAHAETCFWGA